MLCVSPTAADSLLPSSRQVIHDASQRLCGAGPAPGSEPWGISYAGVSDRVRSQRRREEE